MLCEYSKFSNTCRHRFLTYLTEWRPFFTLDLSPYLHSTGANATLSSSLVVSSRRLTALRQLHSDCDVTIVSGKRYTILIYYRFNKLSVTAERGVANGIGLDQDLAASGTTKLQWLNVQPCIIYLL